MKLSDEDLSRLNEFWLYCSENQYFNVGYPESADFDYSELEKFMKFSKNKSFLRLNTFLFLRLNQISVSVSLGFCFGGCWLRQSNFMRPMLKFDVCGGQALLRSTFWLHA